MEGVSDETWVERVKRLFASSKAGDDPKFSDDMNRSMRIDDAQFKADKEMLDEIHRMLRHLVAQSER